ncbi:MAG: O-antigen ligase family protein [Elusimicrobia bacterium]|nr:O-antigen ligase family protein [Elusimicrobiota bacterium]
MSEVSPIFHPRHFAGLATALPFMFVPVIYGLAPRLTAPAAATLLALWVTAVLIVNAGKNQNPGIEKVPLLCFLLTAIGLYLALISRHAPSAAKESGLATASVVLYVSALSAYSFDADHDLLRFTIMAGGWFVACVFIGVRIFYPASGIDGIALSNANILAMHMALLLPCSLASCWRSKTRQERLFFALMAATYSITLLLTRSFGVILALILAAAVIIYQARAYIALLAGIKKLPKVAATALILGCLAAVAVKAVKHPESFSDRLKWQGSALAMFADSPLTGNIYKGGFFSLYPLYKPSRIELNTNFSHNVYLELLSHWGVVGGILFVFLIFAWRQFLPSRLPMELKTTLFIVFITGFYDSNIVFICHLLQQTVAAI